nr:MAG TPA: hypothetical protein [Caudoviricetes sp.]
MLLLYSFAFSPILMLNSIIQLRFRRRAALNFTPHMP